MRRGFLLDGDRRRQPLDGVDVRLFHHGQKLARIGRQALNIAPLAFGINRVEGQGRFTGAGEAGDDDEPIAREGQVDVAQVVRARTANLDGVHEDKGPVAGETGINPGV